MGWKPSRSSELGPAVRQALESLYKKIANVFTATEDGLVPASGGGTTTYLRADGTWSTIPGGGDLLSTNNLSDLASAATARTNLGLGSASTTSSAAYDAAGAAAAAQAAAIAASQPLDTDLSAIAALVSAADKLPYATGAGTWSLTTFTNNARQLLDDTNFNQMRTTLGLEIGADVQGYDAELAALASTTSAADTLPYFTGVGTAGTTAFTAFARTLIDDADAATMRGTLGLGSAATTSSAAYDAAGAAAAAQAASQPLDTDLTAIAALVSAADQMPYATGAGTWSLTTITSTARSMLAETSKPNLRTFLGLTIGTDVQAYDAELAAVAGLTSAADALPYFTGVGTASTTTLTTFGRSLIDDADAATARTTLGLVIGTNVQAYDAELAAIAGLTSAADSAPYFTGVGTAALMTVTSAARTVLDDTTVSAMRTTLGSKPPQIDVFTGNGTWTKPSGAVAVEVTLVGGGGHGGSGRRGAAASGRYGGAGGGNGARVRHTFDASALGATETVTVAATQTGGGTAVTANDTSGNAGTGGNNTTFGTWLLARGGGGGAGGTNALINYYTFAGGMRDGSLIGVTSLPPNPGSGGRGGAGTTDAPAPGQPDYVAMGGGGGGGGGGIDAGNVNGNGAAGGQKPATASGGGTAGTGAAGAGGAGTAGTANIALGGGGGGGGSYNGGTGGAGALYGGGGGGGGGSTNGTNSGAGGNGAAGIAVVITYF